MVLTNLATGRHGPPQLAQPVEMQIKLFSATAARHLAQTAPYRTSRSEPS
jgi:hypothetical protein